MKGGTLFSGIGAPECAMPSIDWRWCAEIDPFASAVHAARFLRVVNLGDVEQIDAARIEPVDLVVFGSPCQSFSVAGKRLGLDDPRGNLALVGLRLIGKLRPRWVVWENVPGVLSSDGGRDFGAFLGFLGELGYGFAYAVLDAQHFGVPQRRRRVFVVGCLGDWRGPAAVLFEPESLRGDSAPRREAGERTSPSLAPGTGGGSGHQYRQKGNEDALIAARPTDLQANDNQVRTAGGELVGVFDSHWAAVAAIIRMSHPEFKSLGGDSADNLAEEATMRLRLARKRSRRDVVFDSGEQPCACFEPRDFSRHICPKCGGITAFCISCSFDHHERGWNTCAAEDNLIAFSAKDHGGDAGSTAPTLRAGMHHGSHANAGVMPAIAHSLRADGFDASKDGTGRGTPIIPVQNATRGKSQNGLGVGGESMFTLDAGSQHAVATPLTLAIRGRGDSHDLEYRDDGTANAILTPNGGRAGIGVGAVAFHENQRAETTLNDTAGSLKTGGGKPGQGYPATMHGMSVRRLTPRECERLQGFPDFFTAISYRGKPAADGPRYRALGNSMAVPVIKWIGERIRRLAEQDAVE